MRKRIAVGMALVLAGGAAIEVFQGMASPPRPPRVRYVVAICARQVRDTRWRVDNDALVTGADVARMVHDAFDRP
jgi:hypothetical protein